MLAGRHTRYVATDNRAMRHGTGRQWCGTAGVRHGSGAARLGCGTAAVRHCSGAAPGRHRDIMSQQCDARQQRVAWGHNEEYCCLPVAH